MNRVTPSEITSEHEITFATLWECLFPEVDLHHQYKGIPGRRFAFDFAHLPSKVAIEINGGIWVKSGHSSGSGLLADYEKSLLGQWAGWRVIPLAPEMITEKNLRILAEMMR